MKLVVKSRFGVTPNSLLNNSEISFKAKGIYAYIQSKPDDWDFSTERMANAGVEGRDAIRTGVQELEAAGYLRRSQVKNEQGLFEMQYELFDEPVLDNPTPDEPRPDNPTPDNPASNKERDTKKEIQKKIQENIFIFWNEKGVKEHKKIDSFIKHIDKRLKQFSEEDIKTAITNYSKIVLNPACYFNHKWTLGEFLQRENGMPVFLYKTEADYLSNKTPEKKTPALLSRKPSTSFDYFG